MEVADMKLNIEASVLDRTVRQLWDAASVMNLGRTYPAPEMLTSAHESLHSYLHAVRIAGEALADAANHAATSADNINWSFDRADASLANSSERKVA